MKVQKISAIVVSAAMLALCSLFAGCAYHVETQAKFKLGKQVEQREPNKKWTDEKTGKESDKPAEVPIMDLCNMHDRDFFREDSVAGGAVTNPERQTKHWEKRIVEEKGQTDIKGCPDPAQRKALIDEGYTHTDTFMSVDTKPEESQPLTPAMSSRRGFGAASVHKAEDAGANFTTSGLYGILRKPDKVTQSQTGSGNAINAPGPVTAGASSSSSAAAAAAAAAAAGSSSSSGGGGSGNHHGGGCN